MVSTLVEEWEETIKENPNNHMVNVEAIHWNTPEGCVSIVFEQMNGGSLHVRYLTLEHALECWCVTRKPLARHC